MVRGNGNGGASTAETWTPPCSGNSPARTTCGQAAALPLSITVSSTTNPGTTQSPGPALPVRADKTRSEVAQESYRAAK